jgi:glycolate oxidase FAD binding subunit
LTVEQFQDRIRAAAASGEKLRLRGGGTKDFYGNTLSGEILDTRGYAGIVAYEPSELVVTARCGTPLAELENTLAENRQCLPFEPPHFGAGATLGGSVAAGLSGPGRAAAGALRDFVLGIKLIDGRAQALDFGGQVMKNVAGYDVSRLLAGSLGTLGLIAEVSLKLAPRPQSEATLRLEMPQARTLETMNRWAGQPLPVSATAWHDGELMVRLSGSAAGVRAAAAKIGGEPVDAPFWNGIREHTDAFFSGPEPLWRLSLPSTAPALQLEGRQLAEWNGGLRWLKSGIDATLVREAAQRVKGNATLFRAQDKKANCFAPLAPVLERVHRELKAAFDPAGIFNRGRLLPGL